MLVIVLCGLAGILYGGSVTLVWDPNPASDIAGYRLHCGTASGIYTQITDVGNVTSVDISALQTGKCYFFAVTDYNLTGQESADSNEVSYTVPTTTPVPSPTLTPNPPPTPTPTANPTVSPSASPTPTATAASGANIVSPVPGSRFSSSTVIFSWVPNNATAYALTLGSGFKGTDIYSSGQLTALSGTASSLPTDGRTVYATLYSKVNNSWVTNNYTYTASTAAATPTPASSSTPVPTPTPTPTAKPSPTPTPAPTPSSTPNILISVVSRKVHGSAGPFDISLPLTGTTGVECRSGGTSGSYQIVATFTGIVSVNTVSVTSGSGSVANVTASGNQLTVALTNVANDQTILVTFAGARVIAGSTTYTFSVPMGVLLGDTTGDGIVSSSDVSQTSGRSGSVVNASTFRSDVNADGVIDSADVVLIQSNVGTALH